MGVTGGVPFRMPRKTSAILLGGIVAALLFVASIVAKDHLAVATHSGLFGICGPYGDGWSIDLQLLLIAIALFGAPFAGFFAGRWLWIRRA